MSQPTKPKRERTLDPFMIRLDAKTHRALKLYQLGMDLTNLSEAARHAMRRTFKEEGLLKP